MGKQIVKLKYILSIYARLSMGCDLRSRIFYYDNNFKKLAHNDHFPSSTIVSETLLSIIKRGYIAAILLVNLM
jgi:hypothetical protein